MAIVVASQSRASVEGKFFLLGGRKFHVKGVTYGPFGGDKETLEAKFTSPERTARDFGQMRTLGANLVRVYEVPPKWFLDLALANELRVLVDVPWNKHLCFLDSRKEREHAREAVRRAVVACGRHAAVFAFSVANEIAPDIVRWSGTDAVAAFIDELIGEAKAADPGCLCTFTNYPSTEFLRPQTMDFVCFNVYLHQRRPFRDYLARLQLEAESRPLVLGEIGIDSLREGEPRKSQMLSWQIEEAFRGGLAGAVVFSFTDDWSKEGEPVCGWQMGLTTREREPKESFAAVQAAFAAAPKYPLSRSPKVTVVVASYNAERTLKACLDSLQALHYPDYEVVLVDDGSTDKTAELAKVYTRVRYIRHEQNLGLSAARNTGIAAAHGEIVAFTDADCRVDEDWLYFLVSGLLEEDFAAIGGPNLLPPEDSSVAAAVMASPGGPAPVMLTERQAEHIPGCNMAFWKHALQETGCFDPIFRRAGDDVDLCWRLRQAGHKIGYSPGGFVWHYRRSTVRDYLRQQHGYGEAEVLLVRKHPEYFSLLGGSIWRGRIYSSSSVGLRLQRSVIYRGWFGSAGFQALYAASPAWSVMLFTSLEYHVLVTLPLWILSAVLHPLLPVAVTSVVLSLIVCVAAAWQAPLPKSKARLWSRPLIAALFLLQPIVRGWARHQGRLLQQRRWPAETERLDSVALRESGRSLSQLEYWSSEPIARFAWLQDLLKRLDEKGWPNRADMGWGDYDVEIQGARWSAVQLITVVEDHGVGKHVIRCRLRPRWGLMAKVIFWALAGAEACLLAAKADRSVWWWGTLLVLPLFAWIVRQEERVVQSRIQVCLDELAKTWRFTRPVSESACETGARRQAHDGRETEQPQGKERNSARNEASPFKV